MFNTTEHVRAAAILNVTNETTETTSSTKKYKNDRSIFNNKSNDRISKKKSELPQSPVTFICMEQLAPEGVTIAESDNMQLDVQSNSLKHILRHRQSARQQETDISERVKRFYQKQDDLINDYELAEQRANNDQEQQDKNEKLNKKLNKTIYILSRTSFILNIILFLIKVIAAISSKSLSIISTVVDSAVDLASSIILFWASRAIKKRNPYLYPQGRTRLEPVAIIILSIIMCAASVMVIYNSINSIANDIAYFTVTNTTKSLSEIDMSALPLTVMSFTIVSKAILFFLCYRIKNPTMSALAEDHRNDVASNIVALVCGLLGSYAYQNIIDQRVIVSDSVGAMLISIYIIGAWIGQANRQIKRLTGYTAKPQFLSQITWLAYHHSDQIEKIETVRAFHFGTSFLVEVHIVLPEAMLVKDAHDIAEGLQQKIERLPEVERAFVHIDYECGHKPADEHKIV